MSKNFLVSCMIGTLTGLLPGVLVGMSVGQMIFGWGLIGALVGAAIAAYVGKEVEGGYAVGRQFTSADVCSLIGATTGYLTCYVVSAAAFIVQGGGALEFLKTGYFIGYFAVAAVGALTGALTGVFVAHLLVASMVPDNHD